MGQARMQNTRGRHQRSVEGRVGRGDGQYRGGYFAQTLLQWQRFIKMIYRAGVNTKAICLAFSCTTILEPRETG